MLLDFGTDFKTFCSFSLFKGYLLLAFSTIEQNPIRKHSMAKGNLNKTENARPKLCLFDTKIKNLCCENA